MDSTPGQWEPILNTLHGAGWSYGYVALRREDGTLAWQVDAHREGHRYVAVADSMAGACGQLLSMLPLDPAGRPA